MTLSGLDWLDPFRNYLPYSRNKKGIYLLGIPSAIEWQLQAEAAMRSNTTVLK